jgi:hypothetical protein
MQGVAIRTEGNYQCWALESGQILFGQWLRGELRLDIYQAVADMEQLTT